MKDKLLGPTDTTGRVQYQVLCPLFDTTQSEGNFLGAPVEDRPAITIDGDAWVFNVARLPSYFLTKDYGFQFEDYKKNNWERLKAIATIEMPGLSDVALLKLLVIRVKLAQPQGTRANARIYLVEVSMTRSQIIPSFGRDAAQGSTAFPVFPTPGLLASRESFFSRVQDVMGTKATVADRTKIRDQ